MMLATLLPVRRALACLVVIPAVVIAACSEGADPSPTGTPRPPEASPSPAGSSPTSTPSTSAQPPREDGYTVARASNGADFDSMLGLALVPGSSDEAVIITQDGFLYKVSLDGSEAPVQFGDISDHITGATGFEEGLLGIAFSPDFQTDSRLYLYYTRGSPQPSVLSRFQVVDGVLDEGSEEVLLEIPQPFRNHNGGQLTFGPDGYLYLGLGDGGGGGDPMDNGQDLGTHLASILRVDVSGESIDIPDDNPFAGTEGARPEIYAYGLRNPWRFSFDRETGEMWAGDVGENRWEEVDRIVAGGNYGWSVMEGFDCRSGANCDQGGLEMPRAVYGQDDGCSITGGYVYRGPSLPELDGWYVYGDYCSGNIWALDTEAATDPILLTNTGLSISSFAELSDGELLVITFDNAIYRLQRAE